jgi:uncharacterized membrane protein
MVCALTDGIFTIVMTILVLDVSIPQISSSHYDIRSIAAGTGTNMNYIVNVKINDLDKP